MYESFSELQATIIAVSGDKKAKQEKFRTELRAPFSLVADESGTLLRSYQVKLPVVRISSRTTFVIGQDQVIKSIDSGGDALDPENALRVVRGS